MIAPAAWAIVFDVPRMPEMRPWRCGGTRSAIIALVAARYAFGATCRTSHPISKVVKSALIAKITRPRVAPTAPPKIQGERLPKRLLVRSERAPKTMFAMSTTIDPTMVRIAKEPNLSTPGSSASFAGSRTAIEARKGMAHVKPTSAKAAAIRPIPIRPRVDAPGGKSLVGGASAPPDDSAAVLVDDIFVHP